MDSQRKPPKRGRPAILDAELVTDAAVACVARSDLDALTIRAVAAELGSSPMAIYRHVADRDELVRRVVDRVLGFVELPPPPTRAAERGPWLIAMAHEVRSVLVRYPGVAEHLLVLGPSGERGFDVMDQICAVLFATGRDAADVASTYTWLMVTVAAYAARQTRGGAAAAAASIPPEERRDVFAARAAAFAARFPHLAATAAGLSNDGEAVFADAISHVVQEIVRPRRRRG